MCWNPEVSLNTFIIGCICALILILLNNTPYLYILIGLSITSMQLLEYYAWNNLNNKKIIEKLSNIGLILIFTQLLLIANIIKNKKYKRILIILFYILLITYLIFQYPTTKLFMEKGENGHLIWHWIDVHPIWFILAFIFYLLPLYLNSEYIILLLGIISLVISLYYFYKYKTFGTMWCYYSNIIWLLLIINSIKILYKYVKK